MPLLFKAKVRRVGSALGFLIPKSLIVEEHISEGEEVRIGILKERKLELIEEAFGIAKGAKKPFVRDKSDRLEKY